MIKHKLTIATRESELALAQTEIVKKALLKHYPQLSIELLKIKTEADKKLTITLAKIGGKGLFVKELEEALFAGRADIAVHSMKDVPMHLPDGLTIAAICERDDPRDVFVANDYDTLASLPAGSDVGTSSLRRKTQIASLRDDVNLVNLRGNIQTRLRYLDEGKFAAIILASAGLKRLALTSRINAYFPVDVILPAAGQGAIGIECKRDDKATLALLKPLNHTETFTSVTAERALCRKLGGGCMVPIASFAEIRESNLVVRGSITSLDGKTALRAKETGNLEDAEKLGERAAEDLLGQGAESLLQTFNE